MQSRTVLQVRQDQCRALAFVRVDRTEDVGRGGALVTGRGRARAALCPPSDDLVLLTDTSLVLEPNFHLADVDRLFARDFIQARREAF